MTKSDKRVCMNSDKNRSFVFGRCKFSFGFALCWFILFLAVFCIAVSCNAEKASTSKSQSEKYPDIWYKSFEEKTEVIYDMFFSDPDIWGDEPVVILHDDQSGSATAVGFFSGKRQKLYSIYKFREKEGGPNHHMYHYYYAKTQREMTRKYILPQKTWETDIPIQGGGKINSWKGTTLGVNGIINDILPKDVWEKLHEDISDDVTDILAWTGPGWECFEPILTHLAKRDKDGKLIWAKSFVRFYPDRNNAPEWNDAYCGGKIRIISSAFPRLLLSDGTVLVGAHGAVVRIQQEDGGTKPVPDPNFKVFDTVDVVKAKLELMRRQTVIIDKCDEERSHLNKEEKKHFKCSGLYSIDGEDLERLQIDLKELLFFDNDRK